MTDPTTMTLDELRDWCAVDDGWEFRSSFGNHWWVRVADGGMDETSEHHPYPATIDGAAKTMPDGWRLERITQSAVWSAYASRDTPYNARMVCDAPDEITARYRLAVACRMASKGGKV